MALKAVFFDMGGTIERFWYTPELRLQATPDLHQLLCQSGILLELDDQRLYEVVSSGFERYHRWSIEKQDELPAARVWSEFIFPEFRLDSDRLAASAEKLMVFLELRYYHREMRTEAPEVLDFIQKSGLKIGLISNVCSQSQVPLTLASYGILNYFDPLVLSSQYGRRKPDPAIFHYTARLANVPTSACLYIGDRVARDIVGARKAGYRLAVQIINEFDHGEQDIGADPDAVITDLTELLVIIKDELNNMTPARSSKARLSKQVRAVLFDAGDILYFRPERGRKFQEFLNERGLEDKVVSETQRNALKLQAFHGEITQDEYRMAILRHYEVNDAEQMERGRQCMEEDDNNIQFFEGVRETLNTLKKNGFMLGIITDTAMPLHIKLSWFEKGGFGDVWDSIISSQDLGLQKPAPEIYAAALKQLALSPAQAVFVGHDVDELDGAHVAGMKTIAFNYDEKAKADYYIKVFADILTIPIILSGDIEKQVAENHD